MPYKLLAVLCAFCASTTAFANTYVKCGKAVNLDIPDVTGYELEISSENDRYTGSVGKNWNLKLHSEASDWLDAATNKNVVAKSSKKSGDTIIEITIAVDQAGGRPVGTLYRLIGLYDDQPRLEKYALGPYSAPEKTGTFQCFSAND